MTAYTATIANSFKSNKVYRMNVLMGILNTILQISISCIIWKILYRGEETINGISYKMVVVNFVIGLGLTNVFWSNDLSIQRKLKDGSIGMEFLKPADFRGLLLSENLGVILFKLVTNFIPALIFSCLVFGFVLPFSFLNLILFLISIFLGFLIFWGISLIVQLSAFWLMNVWSLSTIKNVFVNVLAGASIPLWFMPSAIRKAITYTPFNSIYFIPIQIYVGDIEKSDILLSFLPQIFWILVIFSIAQLMWVKGRKRLVVQGG